MRVNGLVPLAVIVTVRPMDVRRKRHPADALEHQADALVLFERPAVAYMIRRCAELHMRQIGHGGDPFESGSARPEAADAGRAVAATRPPYSISDRPVSFNTGYSIWSPKNWDGKFMGAMNVRKALTLSRNTTIAELPALRFSIRPWTTSAAG